MNKGIFKNVRFQRIRLFCPTENGRHFDYNLDSDCAVLQTRTFIIFGTCTNQWALKEHLQI